MLYKENELCGTISTSAEVTKIHEGLSWTSVEEEEGVQLAISKHYLSQRCDVRWDDHLSSIPNGLESWCKLQST